MCHYCTTTKLQTYTTHIDGNAEDKEMDEVVDRCFTSQRRKQFSTTPLKHPSSRIIPHIPLPHATYYARKPTIHRARGSASYESSLLEVEKFNVCNGVNIFIILH